MSIQVFTGGSWKTVGDTFPAGTMTMYAGTSAPNGWLLCDGSVVSRTTYADLFIAIGINFGAGDGSTTFNLPDMKGAAPAGVGTSEGYTQNETIELGGKYNDQFQLHQHNYIVANMLDTVDPGSKGRPSTVSSYYTNGYVGDGGGTPRTGNVTRGKRVGINFIIKY